MNHYTSSSRKKLVTALAVVSLFAAQLSYADEQKEQTKQTPEKELHLPKISVESKKEELGEMSIEGETLRSLPSHTNSITEALKSMPNVQYSTNENSSLTAGEIRPPQISINGAKPYENNFIIDGISNTNTLNPSGLGSSGNNAGASHNDLYVHGAEQNLFYDTSLIDSVTVYSSNVPAQYGGFTGGTISAELRDPRKDRWHLSLTGKHTRSDWFNLHGTDYESESPNNQPRFEIYQISTIADGPINPKTSLLLSSNWQLSTIPLARRERVGSTTYKTTTQDQYRNNANHFAKLVFSPSSKLKLSLDATYAPYEEHRWREAWADSDWKIKNDALRFNLKADWTDDFGTLSSKIAYSQNGYSRDNANNYRYSYTYTTTGQGQQYGGVGDAITDNHTIDIKTDYTSKEFNSLPLLKKVSSGIAINSSFVDMWNEEANTETTVETATLITLTKTKYGEITQSKSLNTCGYYAQADLGWKRLSATPGFRLDYDDFTSNIDLAYRFKTELDTLGDGTARLVAGLNRYYGTALRAYAFDRYRPFLNNQWRTNKSTGVTVKTINNVTGVDRSYYTDNLETPYSDEIMGGIVGNVYGFKYSLEFVHRDHRKQLMNKSKKNGSNYDYWLTNDGKGSFDGLTATVSHMFKTDYWGTHNISMGAAKSKTSTFNGGFYDNEYTESNGYIRDYTKVFYNGSLMNRADMPADNYNAPLVLTLAWQGSFLNDRLRLNSVNRWRDASEGLVSDKRTSNQTPYGTTSGSNTTTSSTWLNQDGTNYFDAYKHGNISGGFISDLSLEIDMLKKGIFTATALIDVTNLFNSATETTVSEGSNLSRGRGFYVGLRCEF